MTYDIGHEPDLEPPDEVYQEWQPSEDGEHCPACWVGVRKELEQKLAEIVVDMLALHKGKFQCPHCQQEVSIDNFTVVVSLDSWETLTPVRGPDPDDYLE